MKLLVDRFQQTCRICQVLHYNESVLQLDQICMEKQKQKGNKPKRYAKISIEVRMKLVQMVLQRLLPVRKASKKLSIKISTAKLILRKYKEEGTFFEKREDRLARLSAAKEAQELQNSSRAVVEGGPIFTLYNDPHVNPAFLTMYSNSYTTNLQSFSILNSPLHWNYFGTFPQMDPYLSGNGYYHC